ncbi:probable fatty acyl-CoA reductase 5 [Nicotiana tomentosiformis]|uniref:probable fatty acyl-CoA reductase 5 n=1 Tax=Nicotiana tomentosiformis TaxID=4098 RepID=UPI00388C658A
MLKKDVATSWTEECQKAFDKIKDYLSKPPVLVPPEPGRPLLLYLSVLDGAFVGKYESLKTYSPDEEVSFVGEDITEAYDDWRMLFDRAANFKKVGIGAVLVSETGQHYPVSAKLRFPCTNTMAEYEACILGLRLDIDMNVQELLVIGDSDHLVQQKRLFISLKSDLALHYKVREMDLHSNIGCTGYLAKILIEKILRVQPNVKKLYLLIRARDSISAKERFNNEVIKTDLFGVLREKLGANLHALIEDRVFPVAGDIACDNLGINSELKDEMCREIDIFVNSAAATRFDERYDTAIRINTLGALNILKFSKQCSNVNMLLHISTAYVCGVKEGLIQEKPLHYGETLNRGSHLEIDAEHKLVEEKLKDLQARNATEKEVTLAMRVLGIERAKIHGWPNTYTFTKAMGEMLLGHLKEDLQLIILRPTIILSTYKEPFPGWIEGLR